MPIQHRYFDELTSLEQNQSFCGQEIARKNKILVIGTFNPNNISCLKPNDATWFYGRQKNWFWKYLPQSLTEENLHISLNFNEAHWRQFCIDNGVIIVDLIKQINHINPLEDFKDSRLNDRIAENLDNVDIFDFLNAFKGVSFDKVIYTRKGWNPATERDILKLIRIKCRVNEILLNNHIVDNVNNIKYCPAPWQQRLSTFPQWRDAIQD